MVNLLLQDILIYSSILALLTVGLNLTYLTTKVPNFAHATFAMVGAYVAFATTNVLHLYVYTSTVPAFLLGGLTALLLFLLVLRPLTKRGASIVTLMIATIAFDILLVSVLWIFAYYLTNMYKIVSIDFTLSPFDFYIAGYQGVVLVAPIALAGVVAALYLLLNKTKFGIAMRATIENPPLAGTIGINTDLIYIVSWFIAGGIAGLAGALIPLWFITYPDVGSNVYLLAIFAAAVVGGLYNVWGGVVGGIVIGIAETVVIVWLTDLVGTWIIPYQPMIPLAAMIATLLIAPSGLTGINLKLLSKKLRRQQ